MPVRSLKTRIAPTPSGYLHFGNLFSFGLTWLWAKQEGADLLLRIDDLDRQRFRPEYLEDIFRSLEALGIVPDQGPSDLADFERSWSQRQRRPQYQQFLNQLRAKELVYACQCSRKEIKALSTNGGYPGFCQSKQLPLEQEQVAWRLSSLQKKLRFRDGQTEQEVLAPPASMQDFIVRKKDGEAAYQIASLVDDLHFGISHIMRGQDLYDSTLAQLYLADQVEAADFLAVHFQHHPLCTEQGKKLSKRQDAPAAAVYLKQGLPLSALCQALARQIGLKGQFTQLSQLDRARKEQGLRL